MSSGDRLVLAIESATAHVGCAVGGLGGVLASARSGRSRRHAESLVPQIEFVMAQAGVTLGDIDVVAVDIGPGLYTGLRVGVTTAMTLAHTLGVPMVGVSSLDVLAQAVGFDRGEIHAVIDARRGELFHAAYETEGGRLKPVRGPRVVAPDDLRRELDRLDGGLCLVGDGVLAHPATFVGLIDTAALRPALIHPDPDMVVALALERADTGKMSEPREIRPMYLRRPDAVAKWDQVAT